MLVTGWDDVMAARYAGLTTVRQPMRALGGTAARLLDERISGGRTTPVHEVLPTELVVRTTTHAGTPREGSEPMRSTRTRVAALLAVAGLALTGCGRDSGDEAGAEGQGDAIDDGKASGTIEVWAMGTEGEVLQDFAAAFTEANPDAKVEVTAVPWDGAHDKIANAIAAGETPDVSLIGTTWMGEFAEAGGIDPMPEGLVDEADFFPGAWESTEVGGTSYGVPWYVETRALYYRTDLAEQAGWSQPPATWDELRQFATDLQTEGRRDATASSSRPATPAPGRR